MSGLRGIQRSFLILRYHPCMLKRNRAAKTPRSTHQKTGSIDPVLDLQELTRRQLARQLHDGVIQSVAALAMRADIANRLMGSDPSAAVEELRSLEELARRTTKELRHLQFLIRPLSLESAGLVAALEDLVHHENELFQVVQLDTKPKAAAGLDLHKAGLFFQIASEAVANARRHSQAKIVTIKLARPEDDVLLLEVQDDGIGFDWTALESKPREERGLGLELMRIRAGLLGGEFVIDTQKERGTTVRVAAPIK